MDGGRECSMRRKDNRPPTSVVQQQPLFFYFFFFRVGNAFRKSLFLLRNFSLSSSFDLPPVSGKSRGGGEGRLIGGPFLGLGRGKSPFRPWKRDGGAFVSLSSFAFPYIAQ